MKKIIHLFILVIVFSCHCSAQAAIDPLPSWQNGANKQAILDFIQVTTHKNNAHYIPPDQRFAVFDQDGTLWVEKPMYTEILFSFDRILALAPKHPEWKKREPFKSILNHDATRMSHFTDKELTEIITVTHTGMSIDEFSKMVSDWLHQAKDHRWHKPYTDLVYQPMLEVLNYFRLNAFKTYIVSGSGQDFLRVYANETYGIPPEQVIGTSQILKFIQKNHHNYILKYPHFLLDNNNEGKPQDIYLFIGQRPQAAFGNSIGDERMFDYIQDNPEKTLMMLVYHDDPVREYEYGNQSSVGTFSDALMKKANQNGWHVISMKKDWKKIFAFERSANNDDEI